MQILFSPKYNYATSFKQIKLSVEEQEASSKFLDELKTAENPSQSIYLQKNLYNLFLPHLSNEVS